MYQLKENKPESQRFIGQNITISSLPFLKHLDIFGLLCLRQW